MATVFKNDTSDDSDNSKTKGRIFYNITLTKKNKKFTFILDL